MNIKIKEELNCDIVIIHEGDELRGLNKVIKYVNEKKNYNTEKLTKLKDRLLNKKDYTKA